MHSLYADRGFRCRVTISAPSGLFRSGPCPSHSFVAGLQLALSAPSDAGQLS